MPNCSIRGCVNSAKSVHGVMCMRVPGGKNGEERRKAWGYALCRDLTYNYESVRVCELHFAARDWEKVRQDGKKKLRQTAVPTLNLPSRIPFRHIPNPNSVPSTHDDTVIAASMYRPDHSYSSAKTPPTTPSECSLTIDKIYSLSSHQDHSYSSATNPCTSTPSTTPPTTPSATQSTILPTTLPSTKSTTLSTALSITLSTTLPTTPSASEHCPSPEPPPSSEPPLSSTSFQPSCSQGAMQDCTDYPSRVQELEKELSLLKRILKGKDEKIDEINKSLEKWIRECFSLRRRLKVERRLNHSMKKRDTVLRENFKSMMLTPEQIKALGRKATRGSKNLPSDRLSCKSQLINTTSKTK